MQTNLKKVGVVCALIALITTLIGLGYVSAKESGRIVSAKEISSASNVSNTLSYREKAVVTKSRLSAVRIISMSFDGSALSSMSGTYFSLFGRHYVITVMHGIVGECGTTKILVGKEYYDCLGYIDADNLNDYMIMEVEEIGGKKPLNFFTDIPWISRLNEPPALLEPVYYTGFPNTMGPFTIRGHVMGYEALGSENIYILSYAWMGASGSGVFTEEGKLIGHVLALDVGQTEFGVEILENVVMVGPSAHVNWRSLFTEFYK